MRAIEKADSRAIAVGHVKGGGRALVVTLADSSAACSTNNGHFQIGGRITGSNWEAEGLVERFHQLNPDYDYINVCIPGGDALALNRILRLLPQCHRK